MGITEITISNLLKNLQNMVTIRRENMYSIQLRAIKYDVLRANVEEQQSLPDLLPIENDNKYIEAIIDGYRIPEENRIVIDANMTSKELDALLNEKMLPITTKFMKREDVFVFSFNSGHGVEIDGKQHLVTNSAQPNAFPIESYMMNMAIASRGFCRVFTNFDCCR